MKNSADQGECYPQRPKTEVYGYGFSGALKIYFLSLCTPIFCKDLF